MVLTEPIGKRSFGRVYTGTGPCGAQRDGKAVAVKISDVDDSDTVRPGGGLEVAGDLASHEASARALDFFD
ncbi:hypothetical protein JX266_007604 [Neoarthrinium moseri]|nr:hypothetical protein JX266_007604 [Neoarthrinium moseri]